MRHYIALLVQVAEELVDLALERLVQVPLLLDGSIYLGLAECVLALTLKLIQWADYKAVLWLHESHRHDLGPLARCSARLPLSLRVSHWLVAVGFRP